MNNSHLVMSIDIQERLLSQLVSVIKLYHQMLLIVLEFKIIFGLFLGLLEMIKTSTYTGWETILAMHYFDVASKGPVENIVKFMQQTK